MNGKRIIAGGLLAGLVLNIGEAILNSVVIGKDFDALLQKYGLPDVGGSTIGLFVVMCFLLGILSVWLYAAVRPRFGAGPGTAIRAGLVVWALASVWSNVALCAMGIIPERLALIGTLWALVEMPLATLVGAWVYQEETIMPR
jgi:hypothetical protein